jgi:RNA polymerase sigma factor (sigma-70 family)
MKAAGYENVAQVCRAFNLNQSVVGDLLNLKVAPTLRDGEWRKEVVVLCSGLKKMPAELFSEEQMVKWDKTAGAIDLDLEQVGNLLAGDTTQNPDSLLENKEMQVLLDNALESLNPQEESVLRRHFGIEGEKMTLEEIGVSDGLSRARIAQIEAKGLRKLRQPSRSSSLVDYATNKGKK